MRVIILLQLAAVLALADDDYVFDAEEKARLMEEWMLEWHNEVRSLHADTGELTWDSDLATFAQGWCDEVARRNNKGYHEKIWHSTGSGAGENIAWSWTYRKVEEGSAKERDLLKKQISGSFQSMYYENWLYNWNSKYQDMKSTGHFTQMVWKSTKRVGCGATLSREGHKYNKNYKGTSSYFCCNYQPGGNLPEDYVANVGRIIKCLKDTNGLCTADSRCEPPGSKCSDGSDPDIPGKVYCHDIPGNRYIPGNKCAQLKREGDCLGTRYSPWMQIHCAGTCQVCEGWKEIPQRDTEIDFDLDATPLQIKTDSEAGSGDRMWVQVLNKHRDGSGIEVVFSDPPTYNIGFCDGHSYFADDRGCGSIIHFGGKCIHLLGDSNPGTKIVTDSACSDDRSLKYCFMSNGDIVNQQTQRCLVPASKTDDPPEDDEVVLGPCDVSYSAWTLTEGGSVKHKTSGKCWHPKDKTRPYPLYPGNGTPVVLRAGCEEDGYKFAFAAPLPRGMNEYKRIFTITKTIDAVTLHCNGMELANFKFDAAHSSKKLCKKQWDLEKKIIRFKGGDNASIEYRAKPDGAPQ